ncbi:hypothetical protein [Thiothrix subterranea]|uniref:hypothetical protein n=1 Tax=Thiothrix subterranea TaxID=2735563 RepID=UPI00280B51DF|nr:hypothetical protein [Thiothrix subterranea]
MAVQLVEPDPRDSPDAPLHPSVLQRYQADSVLQYSDFKPYRPENLAGHTAVTSKGITNIGG